MAEYYTYQKKRRDYGKPCNFSDSEIKNTYFPMEQITIEYLNHNPNFMDFSNILELSEHSVRLERIGFEQSLGQH